MSVTSARPDELDAYVATLMPADDELDLRAVGLIDLAATWNGRRSAYGGAVDVDALVAVETAIDELSYLDRWVGRVAQAFRDVVRICPTSGCGPVLYASDLQIELGAGPAGLADALAAGAYSDLFEVVRDGSDGRTRVVRLLVDTLPEDVSELEWRLVLEELGLTAESGPLHLVVHGWSTSSASATAAGETTADLYDQQGVEGATVLVVDWDAGRGTAAGLGTPGDFAAAEDSAMATGDALAPMFTALAAANPDADVNVTAHSLGNHVVSRALTGMADPTARFSVDLLMVQPAIPRRAPTWDTENYGALVGPRVRDLTITINNGDDALFWYEIQGPQALGDEAADGPGLTALIEWREAAGLDTQVVDHDAAAGDGHLGIDPTGDQGLLRSLTQELIDVGAGDGTGQADVRRWIYENHTGWFRNDADPIMDHPAVQAYFDACQEADVAPTIEGVRRIIEDEVLPRPTPSPGPEPTPSGSGSW